jgi:putative ABC transport system ATP-binding protein
VICVTHDHRLEAYADRVISIDDGLITRRRPPDASRRPRPHPPKAAPAREPALQGA